MLKELTRPSPRRPLISSEWRSLGRYCARSFFKVSRQDSWSTSLRFRPASGWFEAERPDTQIQSRVSLAPGLSVAVHGDRFGRRYL